MRGWFGVGFACLALAACGGGGADPGDGGQDAADGAGEDGGADVDPGQAFRLVLPEGARLCPGFTEGRDHLQEYALLSQIELRPGALTLPREAGRFQVANPVTRVELRTAAELLDSPPAEVEAEASVYDPGGDWETWSYLVQVPLTRAQGTAELALQVDVSRVDGAFPADITVGAEPAGASVSAVLLLDGGYEPLTDEVHYGPCELAGPPVRTVQATSAAGTRVELELRSGGWGGACSMVGETACYFLTRAAYARGAYQEEITDRWQLVYNGSHHNWADRYLLLLAPPDGASAALLILSPDFFTQQGAALVHLDAGLQEISREELTTWQQGP